MSTDCRISVIIPNRNGGETIGLCLEALFRSAYGFFEIIVVDDCSDDDSVAIIREFPCRLIALTRRVGASGARNIGARQSHGDILFFTDADCLVQPDTLQRAEQLARTNGPSVVIGGTYTCQPYDKQSFFSTFQSLFIHYSESKNPDNTDYIASHAMIMGRDAFNKSGGFPENFLPIIEDVEFSHRLKRMGYNLVMEPDLQVQHIFHFHSLGDSMKNGFRKSRYWIMYSLGNRDLLTDSGTASRGLKINVLCLFLILVMVSGSLVLPNRVPGFILAVPAVFNIALNRRLLSFFYVRGGRIFGILAAVYYMFVYPFAVGAGTMAGIYGYLRQMSPGMGYQR